MGLACPLHCIDQMMKRNILKITLLWTGVILFFPVPLASGACCLAEQVLVQISNHSAMSHLEQSGRQRMLDYLMPYGLIWWTVLALAGGNIIKWIKTRT